MPKTKKTGKKKKGKKGGKKKVKKVVEEVPKEYKPEIQVIPDGDDWLLLSFCLVPWEAKLITLFLNFEILINTRIMFTSLKRILEEKIGEISNVTFYLDPPTKDSPLNESKVNNLTLKEIGFNGNIFTNPTKSIIFFDFNLNKIELKSNNNINIDPLLLVEPSQVFLNRSEQMKDETNLLVDQIRNFKSKTMTQKENE